MFWCRDCTGPYKYSICRGPIYRAQTSPKSNRPMSIDYRNYILDHYRNPRNYGRLKNASAHAEDSNPLCGDQLGIDLLIEGDRVAEVRFKGRGCAISQASASMLSEMIA